MRIFASLFLGVLFLNSYFHGCCFCCGEGTSDDDSQEEYYIVNRSEGAARKISTRTLLPHSTESPILYGTVSAQQTVQDISRFDERVGGEEGFFVCAETAHHHFESWEPHPDDATDPLTDNNALDSEEVKVTETPSYQDQFSIVSLTETPLEKKPWYQRLADSLLNPG